MLKWVLIVALSICAALSCYMAFLGSRFGGGAVGVVFFGGAGLFLGFVAARLVIQEVTRKGESPNRTDEGVSIGSRPVSFVPHWQTMAILIVSGLGILVAIVLSLLGK